MRLSLVLLFALVIQVLTPVGVATTPPTNPPPLGPPPPPPSSSTSPNPPRYSAGDMVWVKPSVWEGHRDYHSTTEHPAVVIGTHNQDLQIVHMSKNLPPNYPDRDYAWKYHSQPNPRSQFNTGPPKVVASQDVRPKSDWNRMEDTKLQKLKNKIMSNCPGVTLWNRGLACTLPKPNQNTPKGKLSQPNGKKASPKPNQNAPKGKSRQLQAKRASPKGKSRQLRAKKASPKGNWNAPKGQLRQLQGKKASPKPIRSALKGQSRQFQAQKAWSKPKQNAPQGKSRQPHGKRA